MSLKKIIVSDFTLRKIEEERKIPLLFREKIAYAKAIENFGADVVELPEIKKEKEDTIIYKTVASVIKDCAVAIAAGTTEEEIDTAWGCIKNAKKPILQICLPVSTVTMEYRFRLKEPKMLCKVRELCSYASSLCKEVEFVCLDASRAGDAFLRDVIETAVNSGVTAVTYCDDAGVLLPDCIGKTVKEIKSYCKVPLYINLSNKLHFASAGAYYAISKGVDGLKTAAVGIGSLKTARLSELLAAQGDTLKVYSSLKSGEIRSDIASLTEKAEQTESVLSQQNEEICLTADSSLGEIIRATKLLGYTFSERDNTDLQKALSAVFEKKNSVSTKELDAIIAGSVMQAPSTYHLKSFNCICNSTSASIAHIVLFTEAGEMTGVDTGDGPIDAAFKAIENCVGIHYDLEDFKIEALSQGKESLGSVFVKLQSGGRLFSGNGISTDIVGASIRAYLNALNKIIYEEEQE